MSLLPTLIATLHRQPGASDEVLRKLLAHTKGKLPTQYVQLLHLANGVSGLMEKGFLQVWPAEDVLSLNKQYAVDEFAPGIFLFGSNGGTTGYGFDLRKTNTPVIEVPFVGMSLDEVKVRAGSIEEFLTQLS
jgi:hypothetical protein